MAKTFLANLRHAISNQETVQIGGGSFSPRELKAVLQGVEDMLDALYVALPIVEDSAEDACYKPGYVPKALTTIKAAISKMEV